MALPIQKHALLLILGYVGTVGGSSAAGYFLYQEYKAARDEEAALRKQIEMTDIKIARIPALETDVICLRENVGELVKILPDSKEVNEFVNKLNDFSVEAGVQIHSLKPEKDRSQKKDVFDKVIYKVSMVADIGRFLAFLSLCEGWERFVRVTSIDVKAGTWDEGVTRDEVLHDISIDLETYAYRGHDDPSKLTTNIPNYGRRRDTLQDEIISRRAEIRVERYTLVPNPMRRDPLIDPRRRLSDDVGDGLPYPEQKALVEDLLARAEELVGLSKAIGAAHTNFIRRLELETEIDHKSMTLKADLDEVLAAHAITDLSLRRRVERDVMPVLKDLLERDQAASAAATLEDLRRFSRDVALLLDAGEYKAVVQKAEIIEGRIDPGGLTPEGAAILHLIQKAATTAKVALDFEGKALEIGGAIVAERGSVVVVNGRVLQEGDTLEEDLVVHRITPDRIEFEYRGVVLARAR